MKTRVSLALLVVALAAPVALVAASPAAANGQAPCWSKVISDWYDNGRIDGVYPIACYKQALQHLPATTQTYTNATDVINRAMQVQIAIAARKSGGGPRNGTGPPAHPGLTTGQTTPQTVTGPNGHTIKTSTTPAPTTTTPIPIAPTGQDSGGGILSKSIRRLGPSDPNAIPLPLIILGVLALLLLAAGAAGVVARKLQERRGTGTPGGTPSSEPPATA